MNLEQINSIVVVPASSIWVWVAAVVVLICVALATGGDDFAMGIVYGLCIGAIVAMPGAYLMLAATDDATNTAFREAIKSTYDLDTDATFHQAKEAARGSSTILLKNGADILEVRPVLNGNVLTFLVASDGKAVEKASS